MTAVLICTAGSGHGKSDGITAAVKFERLLVRNQPFAAGRQTLRTGVAIVRKSCIGEKSVTID